MQNNCPLNVFFFLSKESLVRDTCGALGTDKKESHKIQCLEIDLNRGATDVHELLISFYNCFIALVSFAHDIIDRTAHLYIIICILNSRRLFCAAILQLYSYNHSLL